MYVMNIFYSIIKYVLTHVNICTVHTCVVVWCLTVDKLLLIMAKSLFTSVHNNNAVHKVLR